MQKTPQMLHIGCHLSSAGGFLVMGKTATQLGADVFARRQRETTRPR